MEPKRAAREIKIDENMPSTIPFPYSQYDLWPIFSKIRGINLIDAGMLRIKGHYGSAASPSQAVGEAAFCRIGGQIKACGFFPHTNHQTRYLLSRTVELAVHATVE
ncbi:MAG: hypothetical protein QG575_761 [Euryarchaeota archaeon]|nr:hypothetical protein [Euryarchaeota archaeon]